MGRFRAGHIGVLSLGVLALAACGHGDTKVAAQPAAPHKQAGPAAAQEARKAAVAIAAKVKANELGQIPVIMYHRVVAKPTVTDDRTPAQFRAELERLAKDSYVPITAREYTTGKIAIPAGRHPVVLTFDDSSPSQLTLDGMGKPKADTAVAILQDVAAKHPGFRPVATFYVIRDMFGTFGPEAQAQTLGWLRDNGFDIGNHTRDHMNLRGKSKEQVTDQIAAGQKLITSLIKDVPVTLALPYGNQPSTKDWAMRGEAGGVKYNYSGVFLAGYTPGASPFSKDFDPLGIPRIRAMDKVGDCARFCSTAWLDWLNAHPEDRYTSDGDIRTVAFPKFKAPYVASRFAGYTLPY
ncbi:polysaccharide deacetylase family protein [Sphaerisporangium sp. NPDC005288]|uniref:polysaccharide deacetylase family protein n=1 Tax=Sphaerisporangium sp. NPDC005288 TaxID=3155114 RepID=UPI00339E645A